MGVVTQSEGTKPACQVTLDTLPPDRMQDHEGKGRFINEAKTVSATDRPNICNSHGINETDDGQ